MTNPAPAFVVGLETEARIARRTGWRVEIGGGSTAGAARAAAKLVQDGVSGIISFGLAGGLDPALPPGTLLVPEEIIALDAMWTTDMALTRRIGGGTGHVCLAIDHIAALAIEKRRLHRQTGAAAADMESGAVAMVATRAGVPFAVLRAICDPAGRDLPPAAMAAMDDEGRLSPGALAWSLLRNPMQIGALIALGRDAAAAKQALTMRIKDVRADRFLDASDA